MSSLSTVTLTTDYLSASGEHMLLSTQPQDGRGVHMGQTASMPSAVTVQTHKWTQI